MNREKYLTLVSDMLSTLVYKIENRNSINLLDINIVAEDFLKDFLNLVYGYELINVNLLEKNAPAIDLVDIDRRIAIQVTSDNSSKKIDETLKKFNEKNLYKKYDRLIILILTSKKKYSKEFNSGDYLEFDKYTDIIDIKDILKYVRGKSTSDLKEIKKFLNKELNPNITRNQKDIIELIEQYKLNNKAIEDLKELCELCNERLATRIEKIIYAYESSWVLSWSRDKDKLRNFSTALNEVLYRENSAQLRIKEIIEEIKKMNIAIGISLESYIESEEKNINSIINNLNHNPIKFYKNNGIIFHNHFRNNISELIDIYNRNVDRISKKFGTKYKFMKNKFDNRDTIINFDNCKDKEVEYQKFMVDLNSLNRDELRNIYIIINKSDEFIVNKFKKPEGVAVFFGDLLGEEAMIKYLFSVLEVVGEDGEIFSPQIQTNYIVFLGNTSYKLKDEMNKLKNKSNLKIIYFEKSNSN